MVQRDRTKHSPRPESVTRSGAVFCLISGQWENMQIFWIYLPQDKDKTVCKIFHLLPIHFVCYNLAIEVMMVQEHGFIIFFQIMLDEYFISKKKMAQTLDVSSRTLQYNFKRI